MESENTASVAPYRILAGGNIHYVQHSATVHSSNPSYLSYNPLFGGLSIGTIDLTVRGPNKWRVLDETRPQIAFHPVSGVPCTIYEFRDPCPAPHERFSTITKTEAADVALIEIHPGKYILRSQYEDDSKVFLPANKRSREDDEDIDAYSSSPKS